MSDDRRECPYCGRKYKGLKRHIKGQHPNERWPPITFGNHQPCEVCGSRPTRLFYGDEQKEDRYLCKKHSKNVEGFEVPGS